jgi:hypothetical protein
MGMQKLHQRRGMEQGANLHSNYHQETNGWKGRKANIRRVISHCLKQGR